MVPAHGEARVGRAPAAAVGLPEPPAHHPDHGAGGGHGNADQRQHVDDVGPGAIKGIAPEHVQPVQPGAQVVPAALGARGIAHHLGRAAGDVEQRALGIVQLHAVQGAVDVQRARVAEGILIHRAQVVQARAVPREGARAGQGLRLAGGAQHLAAGRIDGHGLAPPLGRGQVAGTAGAAGMQAQILERAVDAGRAQRLGGREQGGVAIERRQVAQPLGFGELGVAHVNHHHARDKPQRKEQAHGNAQPAVQQEQPAFEVKAHGAALAQNATRSVISAVRGAPR